MCLDTITQGQNPAEEGEGWKVFQVRDNQLGIPYIGSNFLENQWITDTATGTLSTEKYDMHYDIGFHLFEKREDALILLREFIKYGVFVTLRKVRYKNVTAKGPQAVWDHRSVKYVRVPCIVAREIFIEPAEEEHEECA
jgi:hypothetical protein